MPATPASVANLIPRRYQEEIFCRAQEGNIIAALDTGSGKTYISLLLIKWIALQPSFRGKLIVFIVPKVPLVEQQGNFIAAHTSLRVKQVHGGVALTMLERDRWSQQFAKTDVLVMTGELLPATAPFSPDTQRARRRPHAAQIFLNIITHSHWSLKKVNLLFISIRVSASSPFSSQGLAHHHRRVPPHPQEPPLQRYHEGVLPVPPRRAP